MVEVLIEILIVAYVIICGLCLLSYLPRLRAWFGAFKKQKRIKNNINHKLALLVPARNESCVINDLFESIKKQTYNRANFDIYVLVKDPNDPTIELTKNMGGYTYVVKGQKCKGDALDYCLKQLLKENKVYDGYIVVDADCRLDELFLEEMNNALASDKQVIQAKKIVKNYYMGKKANSWASSCNGIIWTIIDELGNRYKSDKNITGMIIGTGLMLRHDVVKMLNGWPYRQTLTEDIEFMNDCALRGISTYYYSYAKILVEESTSLSTTNKRRKRWLRGVVDSKRLYYKRLCDNAKTKEDKKNKYFVTALDPVFYFIGCNTFAFIIGIIMTIFLIVMKNALWIDTLILSGITVGIIYTSFFILTLFCVIIDWKVIKLPLYKKILLMFIHPLFYMGYIPIIGKILFSEKNDGWEVIERIDYSEASELQKEK